MKKNLEKYIKYGHKKVEGWLTKTAIDVLVKIGSLQNKYEIKGPICEIGVHHGKLFILMHLFTTFDEISVAYDLFEKQEENIDCSGRGDKSMFAKNLKYHGCNLKNIKIMVKNSLCLTGEEIIRDCGGKVRLFSIDGGHLAENTYNDLKLAEQTLCEGGVVILDDYFNESWPGVAEGTCKYFFGNNSKLVPICIAGNKVFFTNSADKGSLYREGLETLRHQLILKKGRKCLVRKY